MAPESPANPPDALEPAFEALVRAQYASLLGVAYRYLRSADAAEDAVQAALLKDWRHRLALQLSDPLPYLFRAVRNQCIIALRRRTRWREVDLESESPLASGPASDAVLEARELEMAVRRG